MGKKLKTSVAIDTELLKWIDEQIRLHRFANRTHAVEFALEELRRKPTT